MLSALREEPSASAPRRALRAFPPSGAGASAPARSQRERRDGRWRLALTHTARQVMATAKTRASRTCLGRPLVYHPAAGGLACKHTATGGAFHIWQSARCRHHRPPRRSRTEPRAPATVAARGRTKAYAMRFPLLLSLITCLLHDSTRAAAVVGAWNGHPAGWMHTSTPPWCWHTARAQTDGGQDMSIPAGWVSVADAARWVRIAPDVDAWMRSQSSAREAIYRG